MRTLLIKQVENRIPPTFELVRVSENPRISEPFKITTPYDCQVEGAPDSNLMQELRWYLEDFLEYPFPPKTDKAERLLGALNRWGSDAFDSIISGRIGKELFDWGKGENYDNLRLKISSDDPDILSWPWEALVDSQTGRIGQLSQVERRLNSVSDPYNISTDLPNNRVNVLLVISRPYERDVKYRSIARLVVDLVSKLDLPANVHVLRPPTFDNLKKHLHANPNFYHILHFDGHGSFAKDQSSVSMYMLGAKEGRLVFEDEKGDPFPVTAEKLSEIMREHRIPAVVLNACQSGMLGKDQKDPFASVAAALIKSGVRSVVAMAYSLYVSGAQQFIPAFYGGLFETGSMSRAVRKGRQAMITDEGRICARGRFPLKDWLVPALYQQEPFDFSFAATAERRTKKQNYLLFEESADIENPFGFIGRDSAVMAMERAALKDVPAILLRGLGGTGKTTLARGFLEWLSDTEGIGQGCFWFRFNGINSAEYVFNRMGEKLFGMQFAALKLDQKMELLIKFLKENRFLIVWDNFESARGIQGTEVKALLTEDEQNQLKTFLKGLRGGESKVIITSRSEEKWLGTEQRLELPIGGLMGEEMWELCDTILDNLGVKIDRSGKDINELMETLSGHPLAMRVILPKLEKMSAGNVLEALESNLEALDLGDDEANNKLFAALRFAIDLLPDILQELLIPLGLHERYIESNMLKLMSQQVNDAWKPEIIDDFIEKMIAAGLLNKFQTTIYSIHPALTGYLRALWLSKTNIAKLELWTRQFVNLFGYVADTFAPKALHEKRFLYLIHSANFNNALREAERLEMIEHFGALTQSFAMFALNTRNFSEAEKLYRQFLIFAQTKGNERIEATAYHQLGNIALKQRDYTSAKEFCLKTLVSCQASIVG